MQQDFQIIFQNIRELDIVDAKVFSHGEDTGLVVLNESHMIFGINSIDNSQALWEIKNPESKFSYKFEIKYKISFKELMNRQRVGQFYQVSIKRLW